MNQTRSSKGSAGILPDENIRAQPQRVSPEIVARFMAMDDLTGTVSDALDSLGVTGTIGASTLIPTLPGTRTIGTAITLRNVPQKLDPHQAIAEDKNLMTEIEAIHQAEPGDVLVIQGVPEVSNMGGIIATICVRQQLAGAIVDGGVRDVGHSRKLGFSIWSRHVTPTTGKWRAVSAEVNGTITVAGMTVQAGDLVVADETGVCFVPQQYIAEVLRICEVANSQEAGWVDDLGRGITIPEIMKHLFKQLGPKK